MGADAPLARSTARLTRAMFAETIDVGERRRINGMWHCFGSAPEHQVSLPTAIRMLAASGTRLLPINTHDGLRLGYGNVTLERVLPAMAAYRLVPCLNINLRTSVSDAVDAALHAFDKTGIRLLKLEVLNEDGKTSNDAACMTATRILAGDFVVMPLFSSDADYSDDVAELGPHYVPVVRVMGSGIGSCSGIADEDAVKRWTTSSPVPVILDGGIGSVSDAIRGLQLGCRGALFNSCLFADDNPVAELRRIRMALS